MSVLSGAYKRMSVVSQIILDHQQKPTDIYGRQHPLISSKYIKFRRNTYEKVFIYYENIATLQVFPIQIISALRASRLSNRR